MSIEFWVYAGVAFFCTVLFGLFVGFCFLAGYRLENWSISVKRPAFFDRYFYRYRHDDLNRAEKEAHLSRVYLFCAAIFLGTACFLAVKTIFLGGLDG